MTRLATVLILIAGLSGCVTPVSTSSRPDAYYDSADAGQTAGSLFSGDAETLSDDAIQKILQYQYEPPALSRVALMPFGREVWSGWSEELALASESLQARVLDRLKGSPKIYDASYLPSILVPENRTVPHLREAAARYQADLLLVYRSYCHSFEKYRFFAADRSRAYCGVEAVLLDTRTGLVPFTSVATRSYEVAEDPKDASFQETRLRAQLDAIAAAMGDVSTEIVDFLGQGG
jgi:hypothetical protein